VWGPLSIQDEFFHATLNNIDGASTTDQRIAVPTAGTQENHDADVWGAYAYASYFLTDKHRAYNRYYGRFERVKPYTNFFAVPTVCEGCCCGSGAWEVTARWSFYDNTEILTSTLEAPTNSNTTGEVDMVTLGVNWYMNPYVRLMFNYHHFWVDHTNGNEGDVDIAAMHFQWVF